MSYEISGRLFVRLCFLVPLENFSFIWRRHLYQWRATHFDLCLAPIAIEQWEFLCVTHLLWQGASVYNACGGPVTLTPIAERLAVELSLFVFTTYCYRGWDSNTQPSACGANAITDSATDALISLVETKKLKCWLSDLYIINFVILFKYCTSLIMCRTYSKNVYAHAIDLASQFMMNEETDQTYIKFHFD